MKHYKSIFIKAVLFALIALGAIAGIQTATHFSAEATAVAAEPGGN